MPFAIPLVWREQKDHSTDCYFYSNIRFFIKSKHCIKYPNIPSEIRPVSHDGILPVPKPSENWSLQKSESMFVKNDVLPSCSRKDPDYLESSLVHKISQEELNDLVSYLYFLKQKLRSWVHGFNNGILCRKV